jgi:hypothetical protein
VTAAGILAMIVAALSAWAIVRALERQSDKPSKRPDSQVTDGLGVYQDLMLGENPTVTVRCLWCHGDAYQVKRAVLFESPERRCGSCGQLLQQVGRNGVEPGGGWWAS